MIPQRVAIEGFLSYRNQVEFCFDGAPIWMLTGKNGAGKSSVFDAITFALYGVHRGGKDEVKELINRGCDKLAVEFDFLLGEDRYRVQRTVARRGSPTFQAWHLSGPNSPNRSRKGAQPIAGTESKGGLTDWVERRLGLGADAFKMAVLLEQGKSDALLSAKPAERHTLLGQLVDLSRYVALETEAKKRLGDANRIVDRNQAKLATLPEVTPIQLAIQEERVKETQKQVDEARQQVEALQALKVHASHWGDLQNQQAVVSKRYQAMQLLIVEADTIRHNAQRLDTLQKTLPLLQRIYQHGCNQSRRQQEAGAYKRQAADFATIVAQKTPLVEKAQGESTRWQQEHDDARRAEYDALQKLKELNGPINQLENMARLRLSIKSCDEKLQQFPTELDQQVEDAQCTLNELVTLRGLLPHAQRYLETREAWHKTTSQLEEELQQQEDDAKRVATTLTRVNETRLALTHAREDVSHARAQKAVAEGNLKESRVQIERFDQVDAKPTCPYCGQPLSAEHLTTERARLETMLAERLQVAESALGAEATALQLLGEEDTHATVADLEHLAALKAQQQTAASCARLVEERGRLESDGWQALEKVRAGAVSFLPLPQEGAIDLCFLQAEPTTDDLALLNAYTQGYEAAQATLHDLRQRVTERTGHRTTRQELENEYRPLAESYPEPHAQAIRAEYQEAERAQLEAAKLAAEITPLLDKAKTELQAATGQLQDAQKKRQEAEQKATTAEALAADAKRLLEQEIDDLPSPWQVVARQVDDAQLSQLQTEVAALNGAAERYQALQDAQSQLAQVEERLQEIESGLLTIPLEARRPLAELCQEEEQARASQAAGEYEYRQATTNLTMLQNRRQRIKELSIEMRAAEKKAAHYALIAKHLGRDYLQRFLLQQAEYAIVERANGVLDQCSGGVLSMELRPHSEEGSTQKAFDIMVENRATQSAQAKMLPAWLLSGSQRFRVAISLALAIGQYASNNGQGIESVIIDEGFGSLDREGLRDMEEALRGLDSTIKRIILVSHQDDFANAFPHRYAVSLKDGASQAELEPGLAH